MEAAFLNIVLAIIANKLTEIISYLTGKSYQFLKGKETVKLDLDTTLNPMLHKAIAELAQSNDFTIDKNETEKLQKFLNSPEVDAIVRQIYASN